MPVGYSEPTPSALKPTLQNEARDLLASDRFKNAKSQLIQTILDASARVRGVKPSPSSSEARDQYKALLKEFIGDRGRDLYFPFLSSGLGAGPFVELMDGSVKYDMITGIGINFFGHTHPELMGELINALPADLMQGNLQPGHEAQALIQALLARVGAGCRLKHAWLTTCGTMANENALKIIRQKKAPATKILAFRDCFAGRSTAMQEITDNPGYRAGQPVYGEVYYLPFYDPKKPPEWNVENTLGAMKDHLSRYPGKFAALMLELVQGEGGFNFGPRDWYARVFDEARKAGLAIWADEIQTFGRTGELFAYQTLGLNEYVDVVTVAKMLQASVVFYTEEFNPKPGLVAGTFSGGSGQLRAARKVLEILEGDGYLGREGKIARLSARFGHNLARMAEGPCKGLLGEFRHIGGMIAFTPFAGAMDDVKATLLGLFELGVVAFYCGHGPYLVRMLPPLGAMTEQDVDDVCALIERALKGVAAGRAGTKSA
jgi:acetylornithine/N-succinyldiaminopimelate aminotransferase